MCLADAPGGNVYVLDILRMAGGTTRTYCFHGPPHKDFTSSLSFGPKAAEAFDIQTMSRKLNNNILEPQAGREPMATSGRTGSTTSRTCTCA